jgi:YVTN family beta-propeller protein
VFAVLIGIALLTGFLAPPGSVSGGLASTKARVVVRSSAAAVSFDSFGGWFADDQDGTIRRFEPSTGSPSARPLRTGGHPIALATGFAKVWVADISSSLVYCVDPSTAKFVGRPVSVAQGPVSVATGEGAVWVASLVSGTVSMIDPNTRQVVASVALPDGAVRIAVGDGYVWVTGQTDTLTRIDPRPLGVTLRWRETKVGQGPIGLTVVPGAVWVADAQSGALSEIDPRTTKLLKRIEVPDSSSANGPGAIAEGQGSTSDPVNVALASGRLYVGSGTSATVEVLDPRTGSVAGRPVKVAGVTRELYEAGDGTLWATTANPGTLTELVPG